MASKIKKIVGEELLSKAGMKPADDLSSSAGSVIGLYFSAHWCPPCRTFTPKLVEFYNKVRADGANFEIVFISCDRDERGFTEYYKSMPWLAIPYGNDETSESMGKFAVRGIPALILLDGETGEEITRHGREELELDIQGNYFPWRK